MRKRASFAFWLLLLIALVVVSVGCEQILGLGDFKNQCGDALDAPCNLGGGGSTASSTAGTGGDHGLCTPGDQQPCYSGDPMTEKVGICHGGMKTCGNNGLFGECRGEQLPQHHEDCGNTLDDDCNGMVNDGCPCMPGEMRACYTGDAFTQGVGECKAGMQACSPTGSGFGDCMGEVTPQSEDYVKRGDENCDGIPSADTAWVKTFDATGDPASAGVLFGSVISDDGGNVYVSGIFAGDSLAIAGTMLPGTGTTYSSFVAKLASDGTSVWARVIEPNADDGSQLYWDYRTAFDPVHQRIIVSGSTTNGIDLGPPTSAVPPGTFVAALDLDGHAVWSTACTAFAVRGVAVDGAGDVTVGGWQSTTTAFACGGTSSPMDPASIESIVAAKLDGAGTQMWTSALTAANARVRLVSLALGADGGARFAGSLQGSLDVASSPVPLSGPGGGCVLLGRLDSRAGFAAQANVFGDGMSGQNAYFEPGQTARSIALDDASNVYIVGSNLSTLTFGATTLSSPGAYIFLAGLDANFVPLWATEFDGSSHFSSLTVQPGGDVVFAGETNGKIDVGLGPHLSNYAIDTFVTKQTKTTIAMPPAPSWVAYYGGADTLNSLSQTFPAPIATAPRAQPAARDVLVAGTFFSPTDFGTGSQLPQVGMNGSAFVMRVAP